jgi:hypothetical protein
MSEGKARVVIDEMEGQSELELAGGAAVPVRGWYVQTVRRLQEAMSTACGSWSGCSRSASSDRIGHQVREGSTTRIGEAL